MGDTEEKKTWKELFAAWLFQQGVSTVLLVINVSVMVYFFNYGLQYAIPEHLKQIQAGYERMEAQQTQQIKYIMDTFRDTERNRRP